MKYLMSEQRNGARLREYDHEVTEEFVQNFTSLETRQFFEGLGGTEEMHRRPDGVIYVKATSPDKTEVREVVFTPVHGSQ